MQIGETARQAHVSIQTIRYYEKTGLLPKPERSPGGYRLYAPDIVERLGFIRKAQRVGLRLAEIREVVEAMDAGECGCSVLKQVLPRRLLEVARQIHELQLLSRRIKLVARLQACQPKGKGRACDMGRLLPLDRRRGQRQRSPLAIGSEGEKVSPDAQPSSRSIA